MTDLHRILFLAHFRDIDHESNTIDLFNKIKNFFIVDGTESKSKDELLQTILDSSEVWDALNEDDRVAPKKIVEDYKNGVAYQAPPSVEDTKKKLATGIGALFKKKTEAVAVPNFLEHVNDSIIERAKIRLT